MIKNLRKKFIIVAMSSTFLVLVVIMGIMNISNYVRMIEKADNMIKILDDNDGKFPAVMPENNTKPLEDKRDGDITHFDDFSPETPFEIRYFTVTLNNDGKVTDSDTGKIAAITSEQAQKYAKEVYKSKEKGFKNIYRYNVIKNQNNIDVIFVDCRKEILDCRNVLWISIRVSALGLIAVFVLVLIFSKMVFRPVAKTYEKQKRFITDASHELKTPLTIIDANTEVMEMERGENQWSKSTKKQVERLSYLVEQLVVLNRLDEGNYTGEKTEFSISDAVFDSINPFEIIAEKEEKRLIMHIAENLNYKGDECMIRQLSSILLDNALKYSKDKGIIEVALYQKGRKIIFEVYNETGQVEQGNNNILFERFYRTDRSRNSKTGGTGIGLSIAKGIVEAQKGKINAFSKDGKSLNVVVEL